MGGGGVPDLSCFISDIANPENRIFPEFATASVRTIDSPKPPPQLSENPDFPDPDIGFPDISGFLFLDQTLLCAAANLVKKS